MKANAAYYSDLCFHDVFEEKMVSEGSQKEKRCYFIHSYERSKNVNKTQQKHTQRYREEIGGYRGEGGWVWAKEVREAKGVNCTEMGSN